MDFDIAKCVSGMELKKETDTPAVSWLEDSWSDPGAFWQALVDYHAAKNPPPPRSSPGRVYDFYYDMVLRRASSRAVALRWYAAGQGWGALTYRELHERSSFLAAAWLQLGVKRGARVCLVLEPGPDALVGLVTALRLGLVVSWLPPLGDRFLASRLAQLEPDLIVTASTYRGLLKGFGSKLAPELATDTRLRPYEGWTTYAPGEVCASLFTPLRELEAQPVPLSCDALYLGALRDGLFSFFLKPGAVLAAPGFDVLQHQPTLFISTLLWGATFVHLELEDLHADPGLIAAQRVSVMGVCASTRDILAGGGKVNWDRWFRNVQEPPGQDAWRAFIDALGLKKKPVSVLMLEAASAGCLLFSATRPGSVSQRVLPSAAEPWTLLDPVQKGQAARGPSGIFARQPPPGSQPSGDVIITATGDEYQYGGTTDARRDGRLYPQTEVIDALADVPFLAGSSVVPLIGGGGPGVDLQILLAFTGADWDGSAAELEPTRRAWIDRTLTARLGSDFLPDDVEQFPLYPRWTTSGIDDAWCRSEYLTGMLRMKTESQVFQLVTQLRGLVLTEAGMTGGTAADVAARGD